MSEFDPNGIFNTKRIMGEQDSGTIPLEEGFAYDLDRYETYLRQGLTSNADEHIIDNARYDVILNDRARAYALSYKMDRNLFRSNRDFLIENIREHYKDSLLNREIVSDIGVDTVIRNIGKVALNRQRSALYPIWNPTEFELLFRNAKQNAWLPVLRDFYGSRKQMKLEKHIPSIETLRSTSLNMLGSLAVLSAIQGNLLDEFSEKEEYLKSFDGFIHELDIIGTLIAKDSPIKPQLFGEFEITGWVFPSSLKDDVSGRKFDAFVFIVSDDTEKQTRLFDQPFSIKLSKGPARIEYVTQSGGGSKVMSINAKSIGALDNEGNPFAGKHGLHSIERFINDDIVFGLNTVGIRLSPRESQLTYEGLIGHGLAIAGVKLEEVLSESN